MSSDYDNDDMDYETPQKQRKLDSEFVLDGQTEGPKRRFQV